VLYRIQRRYTDAERAAKQRSTYMPHWTGTFDDSAEFDLTVGGL
jgi:hypothetical protein